MLYGSLTSETRLLLETLGFGYLSALGMQSLRFSFLL